MKRSHWIAPPAPVTKGIKIGLLGGSFNPAHSGHLHISETARQRLGLDYVWWLVAPQNPLKPVAGMESLARRVEFAHALAAHHRHIAVLDIEHALGTRYTIDTLMKLKRRFREARFVWIMGSDNLENFHCWKRWPEIIESMPIAVITRPGSVLAALHARPLLRFHRARVFPLNRLAYKKPPAIALIDGPRNAESATAIREAALRDEALVRAIPPC
ncbi:MAG TPA: nicotinate (nicotinamide) nucleotide adenylyltransferase [Rhizomicrobium sp.]|nr:nicotinate (nicotinamide) nucleotide adenylyltransferase [Rhizomicrobium sp.]